MIELTDINLEYANGSRALQNINLNVEAKEFVFLMGPTGSGKSSILRLVYRDVLPTSGEVFVNNTDITLLPRNKVYLLRRKLGVVFQDFKLLSYKTVAENVAYALEVTGSPDDEIREKTEKAMETVGITHLKDRYPDQISNGEQQLTSIARALVHNPPILLADEPTGNLDPESSWKIMQILEHINSLGTTVVVATHDVNVVERLSKRIVTLKEGKIESDTGTDEEDDTPPDKNVAV